MKLTALNYLVCTSCFSQLVLEDAKPSSSYPDEIISGLLHCRNCSAAFPIVAGVPRFVDTKVSEATNLVTGKRFAESWKEFSRLDNRYFQQFFDWINPVKPDFVRDKIVLEAGCGKGRHAAIMSQCGVKEIFAVDIGDAIDIAYQNVGHMPSVNIIQADIMSMPFNRVFDYAFSVGVLHHMVSPADGFAAMASKVKETGAVSAWVYGRENNWWIISILNPIRIAITSRLPKSAVKIISWLLSILVYALAKGACLWGNLQEKLPVLPKLYYQDYMSYIGRFDFTEIFNIVFDHLIAPVAHYIPGPELEKWFVDAKMPSPIIRWHNQNSWTGFASYNQTGSSTANQQKITELQLK